MNVRRYHGSAFEGRRGLELPAVFGSPSSIFCQTPGPGALIQAALKEFLPSFSFNFHYVNSTFPGIGILTVWTPSEIESGKGLIYINRA